MKKLNLISFAVLMFCLVTPCKAQIEKGKILVGGQTSLSFTTMGSKWKTNSSSGDGSTSTEFDFSPQGGYCVIDNLVVGVNLPMNYSSTKTVNDEKTNVTSISFAPFVRYYFGTTNIKPFVYGDLGVGSMKYKDIYSSGTTDETTYGISMFEFGGGVGLFLSNNLALDVSLGYGTVKFTPKEDNTINYRSISSGIGFGVGLVILLDNIF